MISSCRAPRGRIQRLAGAAAIAVCAVTSFASAQTATAPALKAAFLYRFVKFAQWPADALAPGQRLVMCVIGDAAVADALGQDVQGRAIDSHELTVTIPIGSTNRVNVGESASGCHLLYVSASEIKRSAGLLLAARSASVFTVSDADGFAESGGVAQLIVENDRIRFAINITSALRGRLNVSSKLLSLAKIIKDQNNVPY